MWVFRDCCFLCACLHYPTPIPLIENIKNQSTNRKTVSHHCNSHSRIAGNPIAQMHFSPRSVCNSRITGNPLARVHSSPRSVCHYSRIADCRQSSHACTPLRARSVCHSHLAYNSAANVHSSPLAPTIIHAPRTAIHPCIKHTV